MLEWAYIVLALLAIAGAVGLTWRLLSRRRKLPCPSCLARLVEMDNPFARPTHAATVLDHLELKPGMAVLDVGCGPGRLSIPAARRVGKQGRVVALDVQPGMLERTRRKAESESVANIVFVQAAVEDASLEPRQFDRAILVMMLGEIPNRRRALEKVYAVLRPGGLAAIAESVFDPHFQRRGKVAALAESVGFQQKACHGNCIAYTMILERAIHEDNCKVRPTGP